MKPFFCIDVTDDKAEVKINGEEFLVSTAPSKLSQKDIPVSDDEATDKTDDEPNPKKEKYKSPLPLPFRILRTVCGVLSLVLLGLLVKVYMGISGVYYVRAYYEKMPWLFWLGGAFILIWVVLNLVEGSLESKQKNKELEEDNEVFDENAVDMLNIPEDAPHADIIIFNYVTENGQFVPVNNDEDAVSVYFNYDVRVFTDSENLYLATMEEKYAFALSSLSSIEEINEAIAIPDWNKDTPPTQGIYKEYKMSVDNLNRVTLPRYYVLRVSQGGEEWGIFFPCYELPLFEKATGLKAQ